MRLAAFGRAIRGPIFVILFLLAVGSVAVWLNRGYFEANRVRYLINQHKYSEADSLLDRLGYAIPGEEYRFFPLRVQLATLQLQYYDAVEMTSKTLGENDVRGDNQQFYWAALAAFQGADNRPATEFARRALGGHQGLGNPYRPKMMEALANGKFELPDPPEKDAQFENLSNVEKGVILGLAGLRHYNAKDYLTAREYFRRSLTNGCASWSVFYATSVCEAMANDLPHAQMYLDFIGPDAPERIFNQLYDQWESQSKQAATILAAPELGVNDGRRARAAAWAAVRFIGADPGKNGSIAMKALTRLRQSYPGDVGISLRLGEACELLSRWRPAFEIYQQVYARWPSVALSFRLESLTQDHLKWEKARSEMLAKLPLQASWQVDDIATSGGQLIHGDTVAFYTNGSADISTSTENAGTFKLIVVAGCDRAFRVCPMVAVSVNGKTIDNLYIAREGLDCYTVEIPLEKGLNRITLSYTNDLTRISDSNEDRSFYLKNIYLLGSEAVGR